MLTTLKPILVYERNMQVHLYANCHIVSPTFTAICYQEYQFFRLSLYLILASFKGAFILSPTFRIYHVLKLQRKIRRDHFSQNLTCKFVTFFHWWSRNFLFCKRESEVPRFFISYSVNIRAELKYTFWLGITHTKVSFLP